MAQMIPGALGAFGTLLQGADAKEAGDFNAAMKDYAAQSTEQQAGQSEWRQRRAARIALGDQAAAMGEAGVAGSPSSEAIQRQSSVDAELDALNIRYKGKLAAYGLRQQGRLDRLEGSNAQSEAQFKAGAQLLTSAANYG